MDRAGKLREWARRCRQRASSTVHEATAEALLRLARENEQAAQAFEQGLIGSLEEGDRPEQARDLEPKPK